MKHMQRRDAHAAQGCTCRDEPSPNQKQYYMHIQRRPYYPRNTFTACRDDPPFIHTQTTLYPFIHTQTTLYPFIHTQTTLYPWKHDPLLNKQMTTTLYQRTLNSSPGNWTTMGLSDIVSVRALPMSGGRRMVLAGRSPCEGPEGRTGGS